MNMWLLSEDVHSKIEQAIASGFTPTAAQYEAFGFGGRNAPRASAPGEVHVKGVLTKEPDIFAVIFGGGNTTYADIINGIQEAEADKNVKETRMVIDSPGGSVAGLFDALAAMQAAKKPIRAIIEGQASSAAYAIASQADTIVAASPSASVGSIGIVADMRVRSDVVSVTSTNAPRKRPDITTPEGVEMIREELDALHELFVDAIATGRETTAEDVNLNFGRGGSFLAAEAEKRGMIDAIGAAKPTPVAKIKEVKSMDLNTLKAEHPDVFAAAVQTGTTKERDRVGAFLTAGEASGDMKTALESIKSGDEMTMTLQTKFMMAAANRSDIKARQTESDALDGIGADKDKNDPLAWSKAVFAAAAEMCHVEVKHA